tara:strand:+ start:162 stop:578 length:417 start_codon:yes stop_codon:yes gene_type:complete
MRLVLDTDIVVAAVLSGTGASRRLLMEIVDGRHIGLITVAQFLEYESVLKRPEICRRAKLDIVDMDVILNQIAASFAAVEISYLWRPQVRDANDDMVLEVAVNGHADAIATFNVSDFGVVPSRFGIEASRPSEIVRLF